MTGRLAFASHLVSEHAADLHGRSIHLKSPEQLAEAGVETASAEASALELVAHH